jgi:hypothetical protein
MRTYQQVEARFRSDTTEHIMSVLRDDDVYRHLRFSKPGTHDYRYDLVTWPGYLAIVGDCDDYVFMRTRDMFTWFAWDREINPGYWAEKLQAVSRHGDARVYSEDALIAWVADWFRETVANEDRFDSQITDETLDSWPADLPTMPLREQIALEQALCGQVLCPDWDGPPFDEHTAHERLRDFSWDSLARPQPSGLPVASYVIDLTDGCDLRDFSHGYLWCCFAIREGIGRYHEARS